MDIDVIIKNYRCFPDAKPAHIELKNGFTAFVGANNSGKSTLLKMSFELRDIFAQLSEPDKFKEALKGERSFAINAPITDVRELFHHGSDRDITIELRIPQIPGDSERVSNVAIHIRHNSNGYKISLPIEGDLGSPHDIGVMPGAVLFFKRVAQITGQASEHRRSIKDFCEAMDVLRRCIYIGAFRNAINIGTKEDYFDIEIGEAFIERLQIIQDDQPFKLAELGAGIAQFVVVLANVAIRQPTFVLIDEPELNLHASLQLDFLTSIASYTSHGVVFSTHSIGLARASAERVYSVRNTAGQSEVKEFETTTNLAELLGELSFAGYKELGFERILLVEGPTEVKAVQQLLRMFRKDHKVVLLPLGGASMINARSETELEEIKAHQFECRGF